MAFFVTRKDKGRLYMIEDVDENIYLVNEPYIELLLEAKLNSPTT